MWSEERKVEEREVSLNVGSVARSDDRSALCLVDGAGDVKTGVRKNGHNTMHAAAPTSAAPHLRLVANV